MEWLWKMDSYNIKYNISNSPRGILDVVFCAWINKSALSVEGKIKLARNAIERYSNAFGRLLHPNYQKLQGLYVQH